MKGALRAILWGMFPFAAMATEQDSELVQVGGDKFLRWYGHEGLTYFLQIADPNDPLKKWVWAPVIESGNDEEISYEVDGTANKAFYRLQFTDIETTDPDNDDFDQDKLTNIVEVTLHQTDPLNADTDGDTLLDGWEISNFLDAKDDGSIDVNNGADGDPDDDGLTNEQEQANGTEPNQSDSDGDGISDGDEVANDTDPTDAEAETAATWISLTGELAQNMPQTTEESVIIPAGESRVVAIVLSSDEYSYWTGPSTPKDYNDILEWQITLTDGQNLSGDRDVNNVHNDWVQAQLDGFGVQGYYPAHVETSKVIKAPANTPLIVNVKLTSTNIGDGLLPSTVMVGFLPVKITADIYQKGKTGDQIPSNLGISGEKHYVTPKKTADTPFDKVVLRTKGLDQELFDRILEWEGGEPVPSFNIKRNVSRTTPSKNIVKLKSKHSQEVADVMNVWVIWSVFSTLDDGVAGKGFFTQEEGTWSRFWVVPNPNNMRKFTCVITPIEIITDKDRPALDVANAKLPPGAEKSWILDIQKPAANATKKWDMSRQIEITLANPGGILSGDLLNSLPATFCVNQPDTANDPIIALDKVIAMPTNPTEGNDDPLASDEDCNPYALRVGNGLDHEIGELSSHDAPQFPALNAWGVQDRQFGIRVNFNEFARVELWDSKRNGGRFWFKISDDFKWHHVYRAKFSSALNQWQNFGSSAGTGHK